MARASLYSFLAVLLSEAPKPAVLDACRLLSADDTPLGRALADLAKHARLVGPLELTTEYQDLFIGLGRGELVPFGSYYLTGFLNEKPLARLRYDMARLGVGRSDQTSDPEDHVSAVLDTMAGLIDGRFGAPLELASQKQFYIDHIASWVPIFFEDLERVQSSHFYAAVGAAGQAFLDIENAAFKMVG